MRRFGVHAVWLILVWVALWEELTFANLASGVVVVAVLLALFTPPAGRPEVELRPLATARFLAYFAWKLVEASAVVAWEVVTPRNKIVEAVIAVPIRGVSDTVTMIVANAISLTPGTLTIEVASDPDVLYVHVLHLREVDAVRREVLQLEAMAIRAFAPAAAVDRTTEARADASSVRPSQATKAAIDPTTEES